MLGEKTYPQRDGHNFQVLFDSMTGYFLTFNTRKQAELYIISSSYDETEYTAEEL